MPLLAPATSAREIHRRFVVVAGVHDLIRAEEPAEASTDEITQNGCSERELNTSSVPLVNPKEN